MASAKRIPKVSRMSRGQTLAYARKQKPPADGGGEEIPEDEAAESAATSAPSAGPTPGSTAAPAAASETPAGPATDSPTAAAASIPSAQVRPDVPPPAAATGSRADVDTVAMPALSIGAPPAMPVGAAVAPAAPIDVKRAEDPTYMPGPREIPGGDPDDPAPPPGYVPRGDSRSLRRRIEHRYEFALV